MQKIYCFCGRIRIAPCLQDIHPFCSSCPKEAKLNFKPKKTTTHKQETLF